MWGVESDFYGSRWRRIRGPVDAQTFAAPEGWQYRQQGSPGALAEAREALRERG